MISLICSLKGPDMLMLTNTQIKRIMGARYKGSGIDLILSKTQITAMTCAQKRGFLGSSLAGIAAPIVARGAGKSLD